VLTHFCTVMHSATDLYRMSLYFHIQPSEQLLCIMTVESQVCVIFTFLWSRRNVFLSFCSTHCLNGKDKRWPSHLMNSKPPTPYISFFLLRDFQDTHKYFDFQCSFFNVHCHINTSLLQLSELKVIRSNIICKHFFF